MTATDDTPAPPTTTLELRSTVTDDGTVTLAMQRSELAAPGDDEVVVRVDAAPINPSDLGMMFAMADLDLAEAAGSDGLPGVAAPISPRALAEQAARLNRPMPVGNEGGGTVIATGSSAAARGLAGKVVGFLSGNAYAQYRTLNVTQCLPMADGTNPADAAAAFVNPLTALGMVETMRAEGASHVCVSSAEDFGDQLVDALRATGATIAFDAIGGGDLAGVLLSSMERVASEQAGEFSRYGSNTLKQVYIYGGLDRGPTILRRNFGMTWAVGGWLLTPFLMKAGPETTERLRRRVADDITTTFASTYGMRLSLEDVVDPDVVRRYGRMATGDKALVTPHG